MKIIGIVHELIVMNMDKMMDFYIYYFDFEADLTEPENKPFTWVQLKNGCMTIMMQELETTKKEIPSVEKQIIGTDLIMIKLDCMSSVKNIYERFQKDPDLIYLKIRETEYGSCEFGVLDPEGRMVLISG